MKKILPLIVCFAGLLCGCGHRPDPKIAQLEFQISVLRSNIDDLYVRNGYRYDDITNSHAHLCDYIAEVTQTNLLLWSNAESQLDIQGALLVAMADSFSNLNTANQAKQAAIYYRPPSQPAAIPGDVIAQIRANAQQKWPNDFDMQVYEINKQVDAWRKLNP